MSRNNGLILPGMSKEQTANHLAPYLVRTGPPPKQKVMENVKREVIANREPVKLPPPGPVAVVVQLPDDEQKAVSASD
jgi:hypothetical protein